jgi:hypothetical protein
MTARVSGVKLAKPVQKIENGKHLECQQIVSHLNFVYQCMVVLFVADPDNISMESAIDT